MKIDFSMDKMNEILKKAQILPSADEGEAEQVLIKTANGKTAWKTKQSFPSGGNSNEILIKNSDQNGDVSWVSEAPYAKEATIAEKLKSAKVINFKGDIVGEAIWDGSTDLTIDMSLSQKNNNLIFNNIIVDPAKWQEDLNSNNEFSYQINLYCEGINSKFFGDVVFDVQEALSGLYSPICRTNDDETVTIWAKEKPMHIFTIPSIKCTKEME